MKKLALILTILATACGTEHITLTTMLWHSELCHPEIYYVGPPPNAAPACKWTQVYPPGHGYTIK